MGSTLSCDRCDLSSATSVFTFSEALVLKLSEGISPEPEKDIPGQPKDINDREWMQKIQCIDSVHTQIYGLSQEGFTNLFERVRKALERTENKFGDEKERIKNCYEKYPGCTLKCDKEVMNFLDSVDLKRLQIMIKKLESEELKEQGH